MDNTIAQIRLQYRLAKSAELSRIQIDQRISSFARVYLTEWEPNADEAAREKQRKRALDATTALRKGTVSKDRELCELLEPMVNASEPSWDAFENARKVHQKEAVKLVKQLPVYQKLEPIQGFGAWGLATLIGEAGDIGGYPHVRQLYKRLGWAPNDAYPRGEKSTGRMIPRKTKGRIYGIISVSLLQAKKKNAYGRVYDSNKARHLANGKTKKHAHLLAMRAMTKALIHDVHRAWHGQPMDFNAADGASGGLNAKVVVIPSAAPPDHATHAAS